MNNHSESNDHAQRHGTLLTIRDNRLWLQIATTGVAWFALGVADMLIVWLACVHKERFGGPSSHPGALILCFFTWLLLFGFTVLAGIMSYRSWKTLSGRTDLLLAEGRERKEFMSLVGLIVSVTLGIGFVWLCMPLFILQMCARIR